MDDLSKKIESIESSHAFRKWFGNSVITKTGMADGSPLVLYHGTTKKTLRRFSNLKPRNIGIHIGTMQQAESAAYAKGGKTIIPVIAKIENPVRMEDFGDAFDTRDSDRFQDFVDAVLELLTPEQQICVEKDNLRMTHENLSMLIQWAEPEYDGIVYQNEYEGVGDSYIVFSGEQIKTVHELFIEKIREQKAANQRKTSQKEFSL
jgi:hypothetical protein